MKKIYVVLSISFLLFINNSKAQVYGCPDPLATNYNPSAINNDGSCIYNAASISPTSSFNLASNLSETSGLIKWNNQIWTQNDSEDTSIYALDTINGNIIQSYLLSGTVNKDWEEISQDNDYIYIGDFGNNANGNRTDLKILRVDKNSILVNSPIIDTINFSYSNQDNFTPAGANNTDFDCEAFIVSADSIFLFTKQWVSNKTSVYSLSKTSGTYIANLKLTFDVQGLITGAVYLESKKLIALCGYSSLLQPFIYLLYDFSGSNYFGGNKRKISISLPFHQVEGIATTNGLKYYISNEYFYRPPFINIPQQLHILDLNSFLENYLNTLLTTVPEAEIKNNFIIYPNPATELSLIKIPDEIRVCPNASLEIYNITGQVVYYHLLNNQKKSELLNFSDYPKGIYLVKVKNERNFMVKKLIVY